MNEKAFSVRRSHFSNQQSEFSNQQSEFSNQQFARFKMSDSALRRAVFLLFDFDFSHFHRSCFEEALDQFQDSPVGDPFPH